MYEHTFPLFNEKNRAQTKADNVSKWWQILHFSVINSKELAIHSNCIFLHMCLKMMCSLLNNTILSFLLTFRQHFLCDPGVRIPAMEVTFSMRRLSKIEEECKQYKDRIQQMHNRLKEKKENEVQLGAQK